MPQYEYVCEKCGEREDAVRPIACRDEPGTCPVCDSDMHRDVVASMRPHTDLDYHTPIFSNSAGIAPAQIPDAIRRFPHHEYHPDGRMIFRSHQQRERALREIGLYDKK